MIYSYWSRYFPYIYLWCLDLSTIKCSNVHMYLSESLYKSLHSNHFQPNRDDYIGPHPLVRYAFTVQDCCVTLMFKKVNLTQHSILAIESLKKQQSDQPSRNRATTPRSFEGILMIFFHWNSEKSCSSAF